jgi:hypothetical protein
MPWWGNWFGGGGGGGLNPSPPGFVTGYAYCYAVNGVPEQGVMISVVLTAPPATIPSGEALDTDVWTVTSDINGLVQFPGMLQGATYVVYRGRSTGNQVSFVTPTYTGTATPPPFQLPTVIGEP